MHMQGKVEELIHILLTSTSINQSIICIYIINSTHNSSRGLAPADTWNEFGGRKRRRSHGRWSEGGLEQRLLDSVLRNSGKHGFEMYV
jgi:hypothetical protein